MGYFLGFFEGGLDLFDLKIFLCYAQDNLGLIKVSIPLKNPPECPIIYFAHEKKNLPHFQKQRYINS